MILNLVFPVNQIPHTQWVEDEHAWGKGTSERECLGWYYCPESSYEYAGWWLFPQHWEMAVVHLRMNSEFTIVFWSYHILISSVSHSYRCCFNFLIPMLLQPGLSFGQITFLGRNLTGLKLFKMCVGSAQIFLLSSCLPLSSYTHLTTIQQGYLLFCNSWHQENSMATYSDLLVFNGTYGLSSN